MNLVALLNLALALSTLSETKNSPFFNEFQFAQASAVNGVMTFESAAARYQGQVKLIAVVDDEGYVETTRLKIRRSFIDGAQSAPAREIAKAYLTQVLTMEDQIQANGLIQELSALRIAPLRSPGYLTFLGKRGHFESQYSSGTLLTMDNPADEDAGWLVIFLGHSDGPKLGHFLTGYTLKGKTKAAN